MESRASTADTESNKVSRTVASKVGSDDAILDAAGMTAEVVKMRTKQGHDDIQEKKNLFISLRDDLLRSKRAVKVLTGNEAEMVRADAAKRDIATPLEQQRQKYKKKAAEHGDRQEDTLSKLQAFQSSFLDRKKRAKPQPSSAESYYGQVLEDDDGDDDDNHDWFAGKLKFKKHIDDKYRHAGT
jgi:hypothetical protein